MPETRRFAALAVSLCLTLIICGAVAWGQGFGPETYGMVGDFGMGTPATTRILAMGGELSCLSDRTFSNPAFAAVERRPAVSLRYNTTALAHGPSLDSTMASYFYPLHPGRDGLQIMALTMSGQGGNLTLGSGPYSVPVSTDITSNTWVVDYGRRVAPKLTVGLSVLGHERLGLSFTPPAGPALFQLDATASYGARVGAAYEWLPGDFLGAQWDTSRENVTTAGMMAVSPGAAHVDSSQVVIGASHHFTPRLLGALEFQYGRITTGTTVGSSNEWHAGAEYQAPYGVAVRAGVSAHSPCWGVGYTKGHWRADYTYINDWKSSGVRELFGGSNTQSVEVVYGW